MLNTAGAYFIRESGGTFLGDKGHSCHPRIQCKYRYYKRKFQIIRAKKVHKSSHWYILPRHGHFQASQNKELPSAIIVTTRPN